MIKEAMEYLFSQNKPHPKVMTVYDDKDTVQTLVVKGDGTSEMLQFKTVAPLRNHRFYSLQGFLGYLNSHHCENDQGLIFIGQNRIECDMAYRTHHMQRVYLPLEESDELQALRLLFKGVSQKTLWQLLRTKLNGCIDRELDLLFSLGSIRVTASDEKKIEIQASGLARREQKSGYTITFPDPKGEGEHKTDFPTDYVFNGRIWEGWDQDFRIDLRLELAMGDNGLVFVFTPLRLDQVVRDARLEMVEFVTAQTQDAKRFTVHEGEYHV